MKNKDLKYVRKEYERGILMESQTEPEPFLLFDEWLEAAKSHDETDYNAMSIATVGEEGFPQSRIVLLRSVEDQEMIFFTNYNSDKAKDIEQHPKVCLHFFWKALERQVRILGTVEKTDRQTSDDYFATRPRESQIGAWASDQSSRIESREELEEQVALFTKKFKNKKVPRPPFWGGYRVAPHYFEFWQGRESRLHDRFIYRLNSEHQWYKQRLAP